MMPVLMIAFLTIFFIVGLGALWRSGKHRWEENVRQYKAMELYILQQGRKIMEFIPTADEAYSKTKLTARDLLKERVRELILDAIDAGEFTVALKTPLHLDIRVILEKQGYMVSESSISWDQHTRGNHE